jgi:hypothetical protein
VFPCCRAGRPGRRSRRWPSSIACAKRNERARPTLLDVNPLVAKRGRLATFDRTIPIGAVRGATRDTLVVVSE